MTEPAQEVHEKMVFRQFKIKSTTPDNLQKLQIKWGCKTVDDAHNKALEIAFKMEGIK